jgi:hypothetical protein
MLKITAIKSMQNTKYTRIKGTFKIHLANDILILKILTIIAIY